MKLEHIRRNYSPGLVEAGTGLHGGVILLKGSKTALWNLLSVIWQALGQCAKMEMLHGGSEKRFFSLKKKTHFLKWTLWEIPTELTSFCSHLKQWFGAAAGKKKGKQYIIVFHPINALKKLILKAFYFSLGIFPVIWKWCCFRRLVTYLKVFS